MPINRRWRCILPLEIFRTSLPLNQTRPESGCSSPRSILNIVDFPAPLTPVRKRNSPLLIFRLMSLNIGSFLKNFFATFSNCINGASDTTITEPFYWVSRGSDDRIEVIAKLQDGICICFKLHCNFDSHRVISIWRHYLLNSHFAWLALTS